MKLERAITVYMLIESTMVLESISSETKLILTYESRTNN